jgi:hypothetical protein
MLLNKLPGSELILPRLDDLHNGEIQAIVGMQNLSVFGEQER